MLRLLVLVLVLLNAGYYGWSHGLLRNYGFGPAQQAEPQRVAQQIQPQALRVLSSDEARRADAASLPLECLQAGLFDDAQAAALRQRCVAPAGAEDPARRQLEATAGGCHRPGTPGRTRQAFQVAGGR
jgi:hypothetical protein